MNNRQLGIVLISTLVCFATLYTPQPILPELALHFTVSETVASMVVTATLIPMCVAPLLFGCFLQAIPAKTMLIMSIIFLIIDQLLLYCATSFWQLITLRAIQGFILPAVFTALMTYCATMASVNYVRSIMSVMGWYIAATIVGGFGGRILAGYLAVAYSWQAVFLVMACLLLIPLFLVRLLDADAKADFNRLNAKEVASVLAVAQYRNAYIGLMLVFFTFAGILAILPFRLVAMVPQIDSFTISLIYLGYLAAIPAAALSHRIAGYFKGINKTLLAALLINGAAMCLALIADYRILALVMGVLPFGFFLVHSLLSGYLNKIAEDNGRHHKGVVNGIYVASYYLSGALGSWLPFYVYEAAGWNMVVYTLTGILTVSAVFLSGVGRQRV